MAKFELTLPWEISIAGINIWVNKWNWFSQYWWTPEEWWTHIEQYHDNHNHPVAYEE